MRKITLTILAVTLLAPCALRAQVGPGVVPWLSSTPPTFCPGATPLYAIGIGFTGQGTVYGNSGTGTGCAVVGGGGGGGPYLPLAGGTLTGPFISPVSSINNLFNIAQFGAVAGGCGVDAAANTTAINLAIGAAAAADGGILIPYASQPFGINPITITAPISVIGQDYTLSSPFPAFGGTWTVTGSALCGTTTSGPIFSYKPTGASGSANGQTVSNFYVRGPGSQGTQTSITSCTESSTTGTCTVSGSVTEPVDTQVYIVGNSTSAYNGVVTVQTSSAGSFSFYVRGYVSGLGTGTGGTVTQESTAIAIGDALSSNTAYPVHLTVDNIGGGNAGIGVSILAQDSRMMHTQAGGDLADGVFVDGNPSYSANTIDFDGGISYGDHIQFDMAMGGSNDHLQHWDFENPPLNDGTADMVWWAALNSWIGPGDYYECNGCSNTFTGDAILLPVSGYNYGVRIDDKYLQIGSGANAAIEVATGGNTDIDVRGSSLPSTHGVLLDSTAASGIRIAGLFACGQLTNQSANGVTATDANGNVCAGSTAITNAQTTNFTNGLQASGINVLTAIPGQTATAYAIANGSYAWCTAYSGAATGGLPTFPTNTTVTFPSSGTINPGTVWCTANQYGGWLIYNFPSSGTPASPQTVSISGAPQFSVSQYGVVSLTASLTSPLYATTTVCASSASPAACGAAAAGSVAVAAAGTTLVVDTTAVTAHSQIKLTFDSSLGTALGVTCNTTINQPTVSARTAGTSFTITMSGSIATNPDCVSYTILN